MYSSGTIHYISQLLPVREAVLLAMFSLAEMICLSGCLMNCFDSSKTALPCSLEQQCGAGSFLSIRWV